MTRAFIACACGTYIGSKDLTCPNCLALNENACLKICTYCWEQVRLGAQAVAGPLRQCPECDYRFPKPLDNWVPHKTGPAYYQD